MNPLSSHLLAMPCAYANPAFYVTLAAAYLLGTACEHATGPSIAATADDIFAASIKKW